ncbi:hypothetical protein AN963_10145 [Brevibacillus choshinensis]|uniref:Uncharacterized protein n=1 Tax=Brevibacillus choshinensis TaxID=54911 RepID=A0ABR5NEP7_BRECH|nr:hypothetical protein AN963_10145 [Brevibacillus choshinensis]
MARTMQNQFFRLYEHDLLLCCSGQNLGDRSSEEPARVFIPIGTGSLKLVGTGNASRLGCRGLGEEWVGRM